MKMCRQDSNNFFSSINLSYQLKETHFNRKSKNRKTNHVALILRKIYVKGNIHFSANLNILNIQFGNVEMCSFWLIRKVCREKKIIRALTTHLHNMLSTINNQSNVSFITFNRLWARIAGHSFNYLSLLSLICWLINQMHKVIAKSSFARNINIHSYSTKLLRNNFITLLHLYKPLNYKSNSMRNDYYILKNNARYRPRFAIIAIKKKKIKRTTRSY